MLDIAWWISHITFMLAIIFFVIEIVNRNGYSLMLSASFGLAGFSAWLFPILNTIYVQIIISLLLSAIFIYLWSRSLNRPRAEFHHSLDGGARKYIGQIVILTRPLKRHKSKIILDDHLWFVESQEASIRAGSHVKVVALNGTVLVVHHASEP